MHREGDIGGQFFPSVMIAVATLCLKGEFPVSVGTRSCRVEVTRDTEHLLSAVEEHGEENARELGSERDSLADEKRTPD